MKYELEGVLKYRESKFGPTPFSPQTVTDRRKRPSQSWYIQKKYYGRRGAKTLFRLL